MPFEHQDWKPVIISKPKEKYIKKSSEVSVHNNKMSKLENNPDIIVPKKSNKNFMIALQLARTEKGLSQKELSQRINMSINFIQQCESGKIVPPNNLIVKIENALKIKLPRK